MRDDELEINRLVKSVQQATHLEERKETIAKIMDKLKPFRYSLARKFGNKGVDFDDLIQQIELRLIEAVYDYDETKDPSALRHITSKTRNGTWNYYRKEMNYFDEDKRVVSLDCFHKSENRRFELHDHYYDPMEKYLVKGFDEDEILAKIIIDEELRKLTPHQKEVLIMYFIDDKTQYSIAEELNINQANVSRAKKRAISQLKSNIADIMPLGGHFDTDQIDE